MGCLAHRLPLCVPGSDPDDQLPNDTTVYLASKEDAKLATKQFVASVIRAREEWDAMMAMAHETSSSAQDPMVVLLNKTCTTTHALANLAVDAFLNKIKDALNKHVLPASQGPLITTPSAS